MNENIPKNMTVYDKGQFHMYENRKANQTFAISEREYVNPLKAPQFIVFHEGGEYTVMESYPASTAYHFAAPGHNQSFTLELSPRYTTRNTAIERYTKNEYERLVWVRPNGRVDNLATRWRGEEWQHVSSDMSHDYATALFEHHMVGERHVEHGYLRQNRQLFPGDQELHQRSGVVSVQLDPLCLDFYQDED